MTDREKFEAWFTEYTGYAVNEHPSTNVVEMMRQAWQAAIASQQPADDGWIEWAGGDCPVGQNQGVEVKLRGGFGEQFYDEPASYFEWNHNGLGMDIIAYRVVKP